MFRVNNKDTRMTSMTSFGVFLVNFEQVIIGWEELIQLLPELCEMLMGVNPLLTSSITEKQDQK